MRSNSERSIEALCIRSKWLDRDDSWQYIRCTQGLLEAIARIDLELIQCSADYHAVVSQIFFTCGGFIFEACSAHLFSMSM